MMLDALAVDAPTQEALQEIALNKQEIERRVAASGYELAKLWPESTSAPTTEQSTDPPTDP